jgi:hypothetical protein
VWLKILHSPTPLVGPAWQWSDETELRFALHQELPAEVASGRSLGEIPIQASLGRVLADDVVFLLTDGRWCWCI